MRDGNGRATIRSAPGNAAAPASPVRDQTEQRPRRRGSGLRSLVHDAWPASSWARPSRRCPRLPVSFSSAATPGLIAGERRPYRKTRGAAGDPGSPSVRLPCSYRSRPGAFLPGRGPPRPAWVEADPDRERVAIAERGAEPDAPRPLEGRIDAQVRGELQVQVVVVAGSVIIPEEGVHHDPRRHVGREGG